MKSKIQGAVIVGIVIMAPWFAWSSFQVFILRNCDPKFGCAGQVLFATLYSGIAAVISIFSFLIASSLPRLIQEDLKKARLFGAGFIGGSLLSLLLVTVPHWNLEIVGMAIGWFVSGIVIFYIVLIFFNRQHNENT